MVQHFWHPLRIMTEALSSPRTDMVYSIMVFQYRTILYKTPAQHAVASTVPLRNGRKPKKITWKLIIRIAYESALQTVYMFRTVQ